MRSTYIINHTHNKLCAYVQMYIYVQVSLGIAQLKKDAIHIHATSTKIDTHTHTLFYIKLMIFTVVMSSLDFWSAADKDRLILQMILFTLSWNTDY